jgi:hypothetical protein
MSWQRGNHQTSVGLYLFFSLSNFDCLPLLRSLPLPPLPLHLLHLHRLNQTFLACGSLGQMIMKEGRDQLTLVVLVLLLLKDIVLVVAHLRRLSCGCCAACNTSSSACLDRFILRSGPLVERVCCIETFPLFQPSWVTTSDFLI